MASGNSNQSKPTDNSPPPGIEPRGLKPPAAGHYIGRSPSWLKKARQGKTFVQGPPFRKCGNRILYFREELDSWLTELGPSMTVLPGKECSKSQQKQSHD